VHNFTPAAVNARLIHFCFAERGQQVIIMFAYESSTDLAVFYGHLAKSMNLLENMYFHFISAACLRSRSHL